MARSDHQPRNQVHDWPERFREERRISIGAHTTRDDIDAALSAIALCREMHER